MNKERILALADKIEMCEHVPTGGCYAPENAFDLGSYTYTDTDTGGNICRTPSCIAGWASHMFWEGGLWWHNAHEKARDALDLPEYDANRLFTPSFDNTTMCYEDVTPKAAAEVLRWLAESGVVDWKPVIKEWEDTYPDESSRRSYDYDDEED